MLSATEQIRRMRGGAQSHLMRCSDENYYVVKFQNTLQHRRILVNELPGTRLAGRLGLPITPAEIIRLNLYQFAGMLVFDRWTCNTNGRQTLFFREELRHPHGQGNGHQTNEDRGYETVMIDQGFCFNAGEWNYPDAPLRGLYARNRIYEGVTGMESFAPWLERLEKSITERVLGKILNEIPSEWYEDDYDAVGQLLEQLYRRRTRIMELLLAAKNTTRQPFPNWR
jgi:hypothetical protein